MFIFQLMTYVFCVSLNNSTGNGSLADYCTHIELSFTCKTIASSQISDLPFQIHCEHIVAICDELKLHICATFFEKFLYGIYKRPYSITTDH